MKSNIEMMNFHNACNIVISNWWMWIECDIDKCSHNCSKWNFWISYDPEMGLKDQKFELINSLTMNIWISNFIKWYWRLLHYCMIVSHSRSIVKKPIKILGVNRVLHPTGLYIAVIIQYLRVIGIQCDLKINSDYVKIRITRRKMHWFWSIWPENLLELPQVYCIFNHWSGSNYKNSHFQ